MAMVQVENLTKYFYTGIFQKKKQKAVDNVTFNIERGKTLGLLGESGSGKSTIARLIVRLIDPTKGRILFDGIETTKINGKNLKKLRKEMQIIFQNPETALNPKMRISNSIIEPLRIHGVVSRKNKERKIHELIDSVDLSPELLNRYPHELSGGQIQRVVFARILCLKPRFIVVDEPTSMLDVSYQAQILNLMKKIQKELELTYLFISHDLDVVNYMSDDIGVLYRGKLIDCGPKDQIFERPRHPYTKQLLKEKDNV